MDHRYYFISFLGKTNAGIGVASPWIIFHAPIFLYLVHRIVLVNIINIFSRGVGGSREAYGYVTARDFNNDGTEEIFIVFNEFMFILEFAGRPNKHNYNVIYYGIVKPENPFIYMDNVTVYDIFNRGQQEIIVSLLEGTQTNYFSQTYIYTNELPTDVKNDLIISDNYILYQNFPNPFNPKTKIVYSIPSSNIVQVKLYDIMGREIKTLLNEFKQAGTYEVEFDANNLPSGVYFYRMISGDYSETKKMILLR